MAAASSSTDDSGGTTSAQDAKWVFEDLQIIGNGSFGVVHRAIVQHTQKEVAIKKVLQDKRFKNRELQIMKMLDHVNVTTLLNYFYTEGEKADETFLNLVMDFMPQTVYGMSRQYSKAKKIFPDALYEAVHIPTLPCSCVHSFSWCLPS